MPEIINQIIKWKKGKFIGLNGSLYSHIDINKFLPFDMIIKWSLQNDQTYSLEVKVQQVPKEPVVKYITNNANPIKPPTTFVIPNTLVSYSLNSNENDDYIDDSICAFKYFLFMLIFVIK